MDTIEILTDETSTEALARPGLTVDEQPVLSRSLRNPLDPGAGGLDRIAAGAR